MVTDLSLFGAEVIDGITTGHAQTVGYDNAIDK